MTDEPTSGVEAVLMPCPFCGGNAVMTELDERDDRRWWFRSVSCVECDATVEAGIGWHDYHPLPKDEAANQVGAAATGNWNRRAALATPPASPATDAKVAQAIEDMNYFTSEVASNGICYVPQSRIAKWSQCLSALAAKNSSPSHPMEEPVAGWRRLTALELDDAFDRVYVEVVAARRARKGQP